MTKPDLLHLLEETLGLQPNTLTGGAKLRDLEGWDSMSTLLVIATVDKKLGRALPGGRAARCQTVDELLGLIDGGPLESCKSRPGFGHATSHRVAIGSRPE